MNPSPAQSLAQLHDIHTPPPPGWWPLAPGWWLLLVMILLLVTLGIWLYRRYRRGQWRRVALTQLQAIQNNDLQPGEAARALSTLLRRVALTRYPRAEVAALSGEQWLALLDQPLDGAPFSKGPGRALLSAPYAAHSDEDITGLFGLTERWIKALPQEVAR